MEMERINEDTIRVVIDNEDLEERGITFLDLLGNRNQIENFFYSILEEVDVDDNFHESDAITFQVLPKGNGLELFISKDGPLNEQLDFSSTSEDFDSEHLSQYIRKQLTENQDDEIDSYLNDPQKEVKEKVYELAQFEDMIGLSKRLHLENAISNLYYYRDHYYIQLVFFMDEMIEGNTEKEEAIALEFAHHTTVTGSVLEEHGKQLMEKSALELTRYYFKS
ncbi:adaptor protein MecA [Pisciglobus halotolerans]|uniref:Adapter protein MecA n=1 Tax=Pisciglobus halotolerans TaxID=745365 RepID=A0A1I3C9C3_9LACT|nr:adaptor protein MecA [Pisciglobus halotolerans]SFH70926.1 adapter protein MecA 1/2 [Pisciglobus halotolerans]